MALTATLRVRRECNSPNPRAGSGCHVLKAIEYRSTQREEYLHSGGKPLSFKQPLFHLICGRDKTITRGRVKLPFEQGRGLARSILLLFIKMTLQHAGNWIVITGFSLQSFWLLKILLLRILWDYLLNSRGKISNKNSDEKTIVSQSVVEITSLYLVID